VSDENPTVTFSKKVDGEGRLVIPKEHRQALGMDGQDVIIDFEAQVQHYLEEEEEEASA
jgi:bifunctional DNA-binding transcriptional regulator/antitoxin component of YhaV-PrlF toxin-antitoxin module